MQSNRPRASKLRASGVRAEQKRRTGDATRRGGAVGSYAGVPAMLQRHTCVSREGLAVCRKTLRFAKESA
jgi:hypothetical protein